MTHGEHLPQEDLALHARQALSSEESAVVRAHLEHCAQCRKEFSEISGDASLLTLSFEHNPLPEGARLRFVQSIAADQPSVPERTGERVLRIDAHKRPCRAMQWVSWVIAAALALVAAGLGIKIQMLNLGVARQIALTARIAAQASHAQQVLDVRTARHAQHVPLTASKAPPLPTGRAIYLEESGGLIFQANNLGPLPANKTFELWVIPANGQAPIPAGLFRRIQQETQKWCCHWE